MAHGLADSEMKKEYFDDQQTLDDKLDKLTQWIKDSKHFIVFTGMFLVNYIECIQAYLLNRSRGVNLDWDTRLP